MRNREAEKSNYLAIKRETLEEELRTLKLDLAECVPLGCKTGWGNPGTLEDTRRYNAICRRIDYIESKLIELYQ